jgi:cephalosporin hydroxylase
MEQAMHQNVNGVPQKRTKLMGKAISWYRTNILAGLAGQRFNELLKENHGNPHKLVEIANGFRYHWLFSRPSIGLQMFQVPSEIRAFAEIVAKLQPRKVLEIGTAGGGTLFLWCGLAQAEAVLVSLDLPGGPFGGGYSKEQEKLYNYFAHGGQVLHLLRADSHDPSNLGTVIELLGRDIDLLFIDGDHSYDGVKMDHQMYSPLVRTGGIAAFHDIVHHRDPHVEVDKFWGELRHRYVVEEIVEDYKQGWGGIGYYIQG